MEFEKFELGEVVKLKVDDNLKLVIIGVLQANEYKCLFVNPVTGSPEKQDFHSVALQHDRETRMQ